MPADSAGNLWIPHPGGKPCPDCQGTGRYHGLLVVEDCRNCSGAGHAATCDQATAAAWPLPAWAPVGTICSGTVSLKAGHRGQVYDASGRSLPDVVEANLDRGTYVVIDRPASIRHGSTWYQSMATPPPLYFVPGAVAPSPDDEAMA